jgi:hypothetical protein
MLLLLDRVLAHRTAEAVTGVRHELPVVLRTHAVGTPNK